MADKYFQLALAVDAKDEKISHHSSFDSDRRILCEIEGVTFLGEPPTPVDRNNPIIIRGMFAAF